MNLSTSTEEEDPRSIKIRKGHKRIYEYFDVLNDTNKYYPDENLELFDDIFLSFLKEEEYNACLTALKLLFQKIEFYWLEKANCKIAFNIGKLLDCFLTKFKHQLTEYDKINLHEIASIITSDSLKLHQLNDTQYVIAVVFLKHYDPLSYKQEENEIIRRLENPDGTDSCVKSLIENYYPYPNIELKELIYFQLRSFVLIRNTMMITEDFIKKTMNVLLDDYRDDWIKIYANKMLSHIIVPIISYSQNKVNWGKMQIDEKLLLEWLLVFSERSFGQKARPDKWESINEEDFVLTWQFVKEHASQKEQRNFHKYLIDNGFEFHLSDPHSGSCFDNVTRN